MKLRTAALLGLLALVGAVVLALILSVAAVINRSARNQVRGDIERNVVVFRDVLAYQQTQLENDARIVADEPRIRALFSGDVDDATILGGAQRARQRLGSSLLILVDEDGFLLADVDHPEDAGANMLENDVTGPVLRAALEGGTGQGVWTTESEVYRVQAQRVSIGRVNRGAVLLGFAFDDGDATTLERQVGSAVVITLDGKVVAASESSNVAHGPVSTALAELGETPVEVDVAGKEYLAVASPFPGYQGNRALRYIVLEDLEAALKPGRQMLHILYIVFAVAVAIAILLALVFSSRLSRPLEQLIDFTEEIASGRLEPRPDIGGLAEVRTLGESMNSMVTELDESRRQMVEKERLEGELDIAMRIQTSILPKKPRLPELDIAARMIAADEVGGDYYDVIPTEEGGWIGIGDVSGHGLDAGLIMMMVQTSVSTLVRSQPSATPRTLLRSLNEVVFDNVHRRMGHPRHMTLSLLQVRSGGRIRFAGAHMDILVLRAGADEVEAIPTPGTWLGVFEDIDGVTEDSELTLGPGDSMVLYTDGITEATSEAGELFGLERLCAAVAEARSLAPSAQAERVLAAVEAWQHHQLDDLSLMVIRRTGEPAQAPAKQPT